MDSGMFDILCSSATSVTRDGRYMKGPISPMGTRPDVDEFDPERPIDDGAVPQVPMLTKKEIDEAVAWRYPEYWIG